ncbi:Holliday junction resolvase RuvX [Lutibacter sp. B2]|nr:Holliday junction resolvase RuvX [Lutibacter sp. B2]
MRSMGLDVGDKTIGIAVSDAMSLIAQGLETIRRTNQKADYKRIGEIIQDKTITKIIVGLPKNMNGTIGPQGEKTLKFAEGLKNRFKVEILMWDERLTTVSAERTLISADVSRQKRKKVIDMVAATYILQSYLDGQNR